MTDYTDSYNQFLTTSSLETNQKIDSDIPLKESKTNVISGSQGVQSADYEPGVSGWKIFGNGNAEFNDGQFRGALSAATINIPNATNPLFSVDAAGNVVASSLRRKDFHYFAGFESADGYYKQADGIGSVAIETNGFGISLYTGTTGGDVTSIQKGFENYDWSKKRSFKTSSYISEATNQVIYIISGSVESGIGNHHFGFRIVNNAIYATTGDGTNYNIVNLQTNHNQTGVVYEANFYPGVGVDFYVNSVFKTRITQNLPSGSSYANRIMYASIETANSVQKLLAMRYFDFWQE